MSHEIYCGRTTGSFTPLMVTPSPRRAIEVGKQVAAGEIIAVIAADPVKKSKVLPHLHLTLAWMPVAMHPDRLDWQNLGNDPAITLIDPLSLLSDPAERLEDRPPAVAAESLSATIDEPQPRAQSKVGG